ncbi:MAG: LacI family DNA-binding transcriptional regulator [Verrucomicrobiota bacterium]|nr:LacI family DNA-binding transcriptional regulator [Verrucomicrobiota bacterium]
MKKVSIEDIAQASGVSRGTVSRAFNQRSDIKAETRDKVLDIARKLNYIPNSSARGLAKGCSECVGIVVPDLLNPFLSEMVTYIERSARKHNLSTSLALTDDEITLQERILISMASGKVDGIIITPCESDESIKFLNWINTRIPIIALKQFEGLECDTVICNDTLASKLVLEHLIDLGHRRIAFLSPEAPVFSVEQRLNAYKRTLNSLEIEYEKHFICHSKTFDKEEFDFTKLVKSLLQMPVGERPTAIFAYDDIIALNLIVALENAGFSIPRDISVTGFDNISMGKLSRVPLTSVAASSTRLGEIAIDLLHNKLKNENEKVANITLIPKLFIRNSTAQVSLIC